MGERNDAPLEDAIFATLREGRLGQRQRRSDGCCADAQHCGRRRQLWDFSVLEVQRVEYRRTGCNLTELRSAATAHFRHLERSAQRQRDCQQDAHIVAIRSSACLAICCARC
eukprot:scaffold31368_cov218-Isochrysis_galbana.AAC.2